MVKKIAYVGIDLLDNVLKRLLDNPDIKVIKVFTCDTGNITEFNQEVIGLARKNGIPVSIGRIDKFDLKELNELGCELLICAGYYYKIPVCNYFPMVNFHPALLPVGRGAWPMPLTILKHLDKSGVTVHRIEEAFDKGDILMKRELIVESDENLVSLMNKQNALAGVMTDELLCNFEALYGNAQKQEEGEYWPMPSEKMYTASWDMPFEEIDLIFRAFYSYAVYYIDIDGKYKLFFARISDSKPDSEQYFVTQSGHYITAEKICNLGER